MPDTLPNRPRYLARTNTRGYRYAYARVDVPVVSLGRHGSSVNQGDDWGGRPPVVLNAIVERLGWMPHPEYRVLGVLFRHADATGKAWP